jgi:hypothetical protein
MTKYSKLEKRIELLERFHMLKKKPKEEIIVTARKEIGGEKYYSRCYFCGELKVFNEKCVCYSSVLYQQVLDENEGLTIALKEAKELSESNRKLIDAQHKKIAEQADIIGDLRAKEKRSQQLPETELHGDVFVTPGMVFCQEPCKCCGKMKRCDCHCTCYGAQAIQQMSKENIELRKKLKEAKDDAEDWQDKFDASQTTILGLLKKME